MRLGKEEKNKIKKLFKKIAVENGYKYSRGYAFRSNKQYFITSYILIHQNQIEYVTSIKHLSYDNIFWDIMDMGELASKRESIRAYGAFTASGIVLLDETEVIEGVDDANEFIENCIKLSDEYVEEFCAKYILDDYILLEENKPYDYEILKCLALFHKNETNKAVNYALNMVKSGYAGRFISGGRGFFERVLDKYGVKVEDCVDDIEELQTAVSCFFIKNDGKTRDELLDINKFCHYGVRDEYGRLSYREDGNPLIVFEAEQIVRGVQVTMLDYGVRLELSLPSSKREIQFFYMIVEKMCAILGEEIVGKNGKRASIRDKDTLMQDDIKRSRQLLKKLDKIICDNDEKFFVRFQGVMSKIAIGKTGNKVIRKNIDRFGKHLHEIQKCDIFYGRPWIEDNKQSGRPAQGIVIIYEDCVMCIPENPMLEDRHPPVNIWFVIFRYKDRTDEIHNFWDYIKYADTSKRYDDERFVVSYSREEMKKISEKIRQNDK